jgi:hypothetical protein
MLVERSEHFRKLLKPKSMLTYFERKSRLPFGAVTRVANEQDTVVSNVTAVLKGAHRNRPVEKALAALMRPKTTVTEAFGEPGPERIRRVDDAAHPAGAKGA